MSPEATSSLVGRQISKKTDRQTDRQQTDSQAQTERLLSIPNRPFLILFGGISGEFARAISRAKIPVACVAGV